MLNEIMEVMKQGKKMPGDQPAMSMNEGQYEKMCQMSEQMMSAAKEIKAMAEMMYGKKSEDSDEMYENEDMAANEDMPKKGMGEDKKKALVVMMKKSMQA